MSKYPAWLPESDQYAWDHPWEKGKNKQNVKRYRKLLDDHGYITPHFTWAEASGKGRNRYGTDVPDNLKPNAIRQAWMLEVGRHRLGDVPLHIMSWFRNPRHNSDVGGASQSRHMQADATDFDMVAMAQEGVTKAEFDAVMDKLYKDDGFGQYPSGARHTDARGTRARWTSY